MYFEETFKHINRCHCFMYISISLHTVLDGDGASWGAVLFGVGSLSGRDLKLDYIILYILTDHTH